MFWGTFAVVLGASVGSFLNVVADRLPASRSLVSPRSHCASCQRPLSNVEMVPILSYIWLKGRCRECGAPIPRRVVVVEAMTALLFTAVYLKAGMGLDFVVMAAAASLLLVLAVIDIEHRLIPNRIVFPSLVVFLVVAPFWAELDMPRTFVIGSGMMASFLNSVASGTGAFLPYFAIWFVYPRGMGGGDPKLVGLIGLMVGYPAILVALWVGIVAGGAWAIALLALRRKGMKDAIPNVPFLSLGGITALLGGGEIIAEYQGLVDSLAGV